MNCTISLSSTQKSALALRCSNTRFVSFALPGLELLPAVKWIARYFIVRFGNLEICTDSGLYITLGSTHFESSVIPKAFQVLTPTIPSGIKL